MICCLDVDYREESAVTAAVLFPTWRSREAASTLTVTSEDVAPYQPGEFYRRELPCLLAALSALEAAPSVVLVDGFVWLPKGRPGLGHKLWEALGGEIPVVGVAKSVYRNHHGAAAVTRGYSRKPLWVTAQGMATEDAAARIREMHGPHRLPTMIKLADTLCREAED